MAQQAFAQLVAHLAGAVEHVIEAIAQQRRPHAGRSAEQQGLQQPPVQVRRHRAGPHLGRGDHLPRRRVLGDLQLELLPRLQVALQVALGDLQLLLEVAVGAQQLRLAVEAALQRADLPLGGLDAAAVLVQGRAQGLQLLGLDFGHQAGPGPLQLLQDRRARHVAGAGFSQLGVELRQFRQQRLVGHRQLHAGAAAARLARGAVARLAAEATGDQLARRHLAPQPLQPPQLRLLGDQLVAQALHLAAGRRRLRLRQHQPVAQAEGLHVALDRIGLGLQRRRLLIQEPHRLLQPFAALLQRPAQVGLLGELQGAGQLGPVAAAHLHAQHAAGAAVLQHPDRGQVVVRPGALQGLEHRLQHHRTLQHPRQGGQVLLGPVQRHGADRASSSSFPLVTAGGGTHRIGDQQCEAALIHRIHQPLVDQPGRGGGRHQHQRAPEHPLASLQDLQQLAQLKAAVILGRLGGSHAHRIGRHGHHASIGPSPSPSPSTCHPGCARPGLGSAGAAHGHQVAAIKGYGPRSGQASTARVEIGPAIRPPPPQPSLASRELAHARIRLHRVHVRHLLPQLPGGPTHRVQHPIVLVHMAPAAAAALRAEQLLQPFVAEHQNGIGLDHQPGPSPTHPPLAQLLGAEQVQKVLAAIALDPLLRVGGTEQFAATAAQAGAAQPWAGLVFGRMEAAGGVAVLWIESHPAQGIGLNFRGSAHSSRINL